MKGVHRCGAICLVSLAALLQMPAAIAGDDGILAILAASALIASQANEASDSNELTLVPSIGYQQKRLDFKQKLRFPVNYGTDSEFHVDLPTLNLSMTASRGRMFATMKYEKSLADGTAKASEDLQPLDLQYYFNIPGEVTKIDREDMSITFGYNVYRSLNIFAGYMKGRTEIKPDAGCAWALTDIPQTCDNDPGNGVGNFNPNGLLNLAWTQKIFGGSTYEQDYTEEGPYIGFSYAWQIADTGTLSFSAAYAKMDGEYKDNYLPSINYDFAFTGDSTGTSFGLTWTAPLGEYSNYFIDFREQQYEMDGKDSNGNFPGATASTNETMQGFTAGVQFYF